MPLFDDSSGDPAQNWLTPGQIQAQRDLSTLLLKRSFEPVSGHSGDVTAVSPWTGAVQGLGGFMGRQMMDKTGQQEKESMISGERSLKDQLIPGYPGGVPGYESQEQGYQQISGGAVPQNMANATSHQESNGNYASVGPATRTGDHAYGKYQVLGANVGPWTQEILGTPMTPQQFMASPDAQEAVYQRKFAEYVQKYGPEGAARAWYGGPGNVNNPSARDLTNPNAPTVGQYGQNFMRLASNAPQLPAGAVPPQGAGGMPQVVQTAQAATPGATGADQMAAALTSRGGGSNPTAQPPMPDMGAPSQAPMTPQGIPPGFFSQKQMVPDRQMMELANPYIDKTAKDYYHAARAGQFQPTQFETPFGNVVRAANGQQMFIGKQFTIPIKGPNGMEVPVQAQYNADGSYRILGPGGGGGAASQNAPGPSGNAGGAAQTSPTGTATAPAAAPGPQGALTDSAAPVKLASLETGNVSDAPPPGMLSSKPPVDPSEVEAPKSKGPTPQFAQSMIPKFARDTLDDMGNIAAQTDLKTSAAKTAGEAATKFSTDLRSQYSFAVDENKKLGILKTVMDDPTFRSGALSPLILLKRRLVSQFGGDPKQAADMELATKFMDDLKLDELKKRLSGFGQIRVFEGDMVNRANANMENSPAANMALVEYAHAVNDRIAAATTTLNEELAKNNWVPSPAIQAKVQNFFAEKPIMDDKRLSYWNQQIRSDIDAKKTGPLGTAPPPPLPPGFKPVQ